MEVDSHYFNIEFESKLFGDSYSIKSLRKIRHEWEFLYFWCNENLPLATDRDYSEQYLKRLKDLGLKNIGLKPLSPRQKNWWGEFENAYLNSKKSTFIYSESHHLLPENTELLFGERIERKHFGLFCRDVQGVSGRGNFILSEETMKRVRPGREYIVGPFLDRIVDIGTVYRNGEPLGSHLLHNSKEGSFKGGVAYLSHRQFLSAIDISDSNWRRYFSHIFSDFIEKHPELKTCVYFNFDSFLYRSANGMGFYPLVELNCRRSMGTILRILSQWGDGVVEWVILERKDRKIRTEYNPRDKTGILELSPEDTRKQHFLLCGPHIQKIHELKSQLVD